MVKVGIIGGSGFVGSHIAEYLANKGHDIIVYDINEPRETSRLKFIKKDITKDNLSELEENDFLIHTAIIQIPLINENPELGYKVNILGLQRVLEIVKKSEKIKGIILTSTWHVYGERIKGEIREDYGYHPDKVDERAKLYAYTKIGQEILMRTFSKLAPEKEFIILRIGTVLGRGMPEKTAASIFIRNALSGKPITPYKHSMYRPMFYVSIDDICKVVDRIISFAIGGKKLKYKIFNVFYPEPITILQLAELVKEAVIKITDGKIIPEIKVIDKGVEMQFTEEAPKSVKGNIERLKEELGIKELSKPSEMIFKLVSEYMKKPK